MSDTPYDIDMEQFYIDQKDPVNILEIDRSRVRDFLIEYPIEYSHFDCDVLIEFEDELREAGFDMNRVDDIEVVKDFNQKMALIFVQPGCEEH